MNFGCCWKIIQCLTDIEQKESPVEESPAEESPFEVEQAILYHENVLESAVVPEVDHEGLIKSKAFIILKEEAKGKDNLEKIEESIKAIVKEKIGLWKYPRSIEFVKTLPKTATGKIQRFKLRK